MVKTMTAMVGIEAEAVATGNVMYECSNGCGHRDYRPPGQNLVCPDEPTPNPDYDPRVDPTSAKYVEPGSWDQVPVNTVGDVKRIMGSNGSEPADELTPRYNSTTHTTRVFYNTPLTETSHQVYEMIDPAYGRGFHVTLFENPDGVTVNVQNNARGSFDGPSFPNMAEAVAWARGYLFGSGAYTGGV
jgi:hypothetical protein